MARCWARRETVDLGERRGAKVTTLISAMALGANCVDDCDMLRAGRTGQVLGHAVVAPSTLGTFLRAFTFEHVRQLDRVLADTLDAAGAAGAGPATSAWSSTSTASSARIMAVQAGRRVRLQRRPSPTPSGKFTGNAAWTVIACLAHNLLRWTSVLGLPGQTVRAARTLRRRLLTLPGRLTRTARR